jgi:aminoglycoside phosphotransferase (APT) family kinase protein
VQQPINGLDHDRVSAWLADNIEGAIAPFEFSLIAGGRSNLTFTFTGADGRRFVLRRPPTGAVLATAHDMAREYRIIAAVGTTGVPVPPALGLCVDDSVNGSPF